MMAIYQALRARHPKWHVEIGKPRGTGWIPGNALMTAREGPFLAFLCRIGERLQTSDRRAMAASFALRFGWSAGMAIAPYLLYHCVPKIAPDNVSFRFHENTSFERGAFASPTSQMKGMHVEGVPVRTTDIALCRGSRGCAGDSRVCSRR
jgi:hypothetical protein